MAAGTITCGPNGSTGQTIADTINHVYNAPISSIYSTSNLAPQTITTVPSAIILGNAGGEIKVGIPVTSFTSFTVNASNYYEIQVNIALTYDNAEDLTFNAYLNNIPFAGNGVTVTGKGASIVNMSWSYIGQLNAGTVFTLKATGTSGTMVITNSSVFLKGL